MIVASPSELRQHVPAPAVPVQSTVSIGGSIPVQRGNPSRRNGRSAGRILQMMKPAVGGFSVDLLVRLRRFIQGQSCAWSIRSSAPWCVTEPRQSILALVDHGRREEARLRIGLITDEFNPEGGGSERWTAHSADHVPAAGHEVHVITFRAPGGRQGRPEKHALPDPRSLYGCALAVEAASERLGPMVLHDLGTGRSAHVFHPYTGSRLLSMEREIRSHIRWRRLRAAVSPRLNLRRLLMVQIEARAAVRARRVVAVSRQLETVSGKPPSRRAGRHRHSERSGCGSSLPSAWRWWAASPIP